MYISGEYLEKNPSWHIEDAAYKNYQKIRMMKGNNMVFKNIIIIL